MRKTVSVGLLPVFKEDLKIVALELKAQMYPETPENAKLE